jgi:hypothetical protein
MIKLKGVLHCDRFFGHSSISAGRREPSSRLTPTDTEPHMPTKQYPVTRTEAEWRKLLTPEQ